MTLACLFKRQEALQRGMAAAAARRDYYDLARHTNEYASVLADIDRLRAALARHIERELELLQSEAGQ